LVSADLFLGTRSAAIRAQHHHRGPAYGGPGSRYTFLLAGLCMGHCICWLFLKVDKDKYKKSNQNEEILPWIKFHFGLLHQFKVITFNENTAKL
jgi:hypothetical protein